MEADTRGAREGRCKTPLALTAGTARVGGSNTHGQAVVEVEGYPFSATRVGAVRHKVRRRVCGGTWDQMNRSSKPDRQHTVGDGVMAGIAVDSRDKVDRNYG